MAKQSKKDLLTSGTDDFFNDYQNSVKKEEKTETTSKADNVATDEEIITLTIEKKVIKHKKLVLSLRQSLYDELFEYCKANDKNITEAIRDAITTMLKENK